MGRSFEMEDIYGGRGGGQMNQFNQYPNHQPQHQFQQQQQFPNQFQDQTQFGHQGLNNQGFNNQGFQDNQFGQQPAGNSIYEHLNPQYPPQGPQDPYQGQTNMAYDPYDTNNTNLPGY